MKASTCIVAFFAFSLTLNTTFGTKLDHPKTEHAKLVALLAKLDARADLSKADRADFAKLLQELKDGKITGDDRKEILDAAHQLVELLSLNFAAEGEKGKLRSLSTVPNHAKLAAILAQLEKSHPTLSGSDKDDIAHIRQELTDDKVSDAELADVLEAAQQLADFFAQKTNAEAKLAALIAQIEKRDDITESDRAELEQFKKAIYDGSVLTDDATKSLHAALKEKAKDPTKFLKAALKAQALS